MRRFLSRKLEPLKKLTVPFWGIVGVALATAPALLFLPSPLTILPLPILISIVWASLAGWPVTSAWSRALHKQAEFLKNPVDFERGVNRDVQESEAGRVDWIPGWIGFFERTLYSLLIGLDIGGGATFIGVWIGVKLAGGWQSWSKGTTYGRATLGIGLLGSAMSALFGVVAGLVIRAYVHPQYP
jgi:hypothetical protein